MASLLIIYYRQTVCAQTIKNVMSRLQKDGKKFGGTDF